MGWRDIINLPALIANMVDKVWNGKLKPGQVDKPLYEATADKLNEPVVETFTNIKYGSKEQAMLMQLRYNVHVMSAFKIYQNGLEMAGLLLDENGNRRTFAEFKKAATELGVKVHKNQLQAEYQTAQASARMAAKWLSMTEGDPNVLLKYVAVMDGKTRQTHRVLHHTVLPASDPFWEKYYPPNGWRCRCNVIKARSTDVIKPNTAVPDDMPEAFKTNVGITGKAFSTDLPVFDYRNQDEARVQKLWAVKRPLNAEEYKQRVASYETYQAQKHKLEHVNNQSGGFVYSDKNASTIDVKENIPMARLMADKYGDAILIRANDFNKKQPDYFINGTFAELKTKSESIKNVEKTIKNALAQIKSQGETFGHVVLDIVKDVNVASLEDAIENRVRNHSTFRMLTIRYNNELYRFDEIQLKSGFYRNKIR